MIEWLILTGEYPPQCGGVGDYSHRVASRLVDAGDCVTVCTPSGIENRQDSSVPTLALPDRFGPRSFAVVDEWLSARPETRILVQYVPQAFGRWGVNLPFCVWLRSRRRCQIWVMFHEVASPVSPNQSVALNTLGRIQRAMASLVGSAADRVYVAARAWEPLLTARVRPGTEIVWVPVPSTVEPIEDHEETSRVRCRYGWRSALVGHVGTFGSLVTPLLTEAIRRLLATSQARVLLMGRGSDMFAREFARAHEDLSVRVSATGQLSTADLSHHVSACDVMMQPYPDGVSTRRTTAMIALCHGRPLVTTSGLLTDSVWHDTVGVVMEPAENPAALGLAAARLLDDSDKIARLGIEARRLYDERFDIRHTIDKLRHSASAQSDTKVA